MTIVRVKGFQVFVDRQGRLRCYHRKTRTPIDVKTCPIGSEAFFAECQRITARMTAVAPKPLPESIVKLLFESLRPEQRKEVCFPWEHTSPEKGLLRRCKSHSRRAQPVAEGASRGRTWRD